MWPEDDEEHTRNAFYILLPCMLRHLEEPDVISYQADGYADVERAIELAHTLAELIRSMRNHASSRLCSCKVKPHSEVSDGL
jgi:hypothetical protein